MVCHMDFKIWLEQGEADDDIKAAILNSVPEELKGTEHDEEQLLRTRTSDFGSHVIDKIKELGIITNLKDDNPERWQDVIDAISRGITLRELIDKIAGKDEVEAVTGTPPPQSAPQLYPQHMNRQPAPY